MIKINLVPKKILQEEKARGRKIQAAAAGVAVLLLVAGVSAAHLLKARRLEATLQERKLKLDTLSKVVAQVEALESQAAAVRTRLAAITDLQKGRNLYPVFMGDFAGTLPPDVWITALGTSPGKSPQDIHLTITANSLSKEGIAQWLRNLEAAGRYSEPSLSAITITPSPLGALHAFTLGTSYSNSGL